MTSGDKRKQQIAKALMALVDRKAYRQITVQDIANEAQINRQTFYYHFADKDQLLHWIYLHDSLRYLTSDALALDNWEEQALQMLKAMLAKSDFYQKTVADSPDVLLGEFTAIIIRLFGRLFEDFDREEMLSPEDKNFYGRFFAYGCSGVLLAWIREGYQETPLTIATQLFRLAKDVEFYSYRIYQEDDQK